jgi:hypothetical protein
MFFDCGEFGVASWTGLKLSLLGFDAIGSTDRSRSYLYAYQLADTKKTSPPLYASKPLNA